MHHSFCESCNRIRLTSQGLIKPCLCYEEGVDLRPALEAGVLDPEAHDAALRAALEEAIKRWHAVYANDINDNALLYNVAIMMDNNGMIGEYHKAWNHVKVQPEPEPEPTPEPESEVEPEGN